MMTPDHELFERLCDLRDRQAPLNPSLPRHPKHKTAYFKGLAEAFEAGRLLPVEESVFDHTQEQD